MMCFRTKRADDMPLTCRITREGKGKFTADIVFTKSRRSYGAELVFADGVKLVKAHLLKLYPTIKFETGRKRKPGKRSKRNA